MDEKTMSIAPTESVAEGVNVATTPRELNKRLRVGDTMIMKRKSVLRREHVKLLDARE